MTNPYRNDTDRDFHIEDNFSLILLRPLTDAAREWTGEHIPDATWFGTAVVVEHRYIADIVEGIKNDGLTFAAL